MGRERDQPAKTEEDRHEDDGQSGAQPRCRDAHSEHQGGEGPDDT
jgi:hypothetical protein